MLSQDGSFPTPGSWLCKTCRKSRSKSPLMKCGSCELVRYCSSRCQRADLDHHRIYCSKIRMLRKQLSDHVENMRCLKDLHFSGAPINVFKSGSGQFWTIPDTRDYVVTCMDLVETLEALSQSYVVQPLLSRVLEYRLELLRLMGTDRFGLRHVVPFGMLALNRDDDCVSFIGHWVRRLALNMDVVALHRNSRSGQWLYERESGIGDIFEKIEGGYKYADVPFVTAMLIVKLRQIARYGARKKEFESFRGTKFGSGLGAIAEGIRSRLVGDSGMVEALESHVDRYITVLMLKNWRVLPGVVSPSTVLCQDRPTSIEAGGGSEAWLVVKYCYRLFGAIPGARARFKKIISRNDKKTTERINLV